MYPGTYQPLQAMSLLLTDLLSYPHSDEAPVSQGLVDAIFDLYQVDHGMITSTDPPQRTLSPSGREAWSMLWCIRSKALKQMDQDPHVVLPSSTASSHTCICGERIAHEVLLTDAPEQSEVSPWDAEEEESEMALPPGQVLPIVETAPGQMGFDWDEWDAYLGSATGTMI